MPQKDQTSHHSPSIRPLSMSSQDSEEISTNSESYDLASLEKDSEILARRAAKRYKKNFNTQSESFVEKFISWHRKKKVDKIKCSLESLFPKLKNSEVAVKCWLATVSERKEVAWLNGNALLNDMETQIIVYQKHLDFLDEVVNDIRQIDYDILKEVSELRIAFAFNQELLIRASPNVGPSASVVIKCGEKVSKVMLVAIDPEPLPVCPAVKSRISTDFDEEEVQCDVDHSTRPLDAPVPQATPAVWQGFTAVTTAPATSPVPTAATTNIPSAEQRPFGKSITALFTAIGSGNAHGKGDTKVPVPAAVSDKEIARKLRELNTADGAGIAVSRSGRISPKTVHNSNETTILSRNQLVSSQSSASPRLGASGDPVLTWDGEESKRKSLTLSCVSLQSLKLGNNDLTGGISTNSPVSNKRSSWGLNSSSSDKTTKSNNSFLGANFTRNRSGTTNSLNNVEGESHSRGSWGKRESDTASALLHKRGPWSSPLSVLSPRTTDSVLGSRTPNEFRSESSSDESCNSLSDGDTDESAGVMLGDMDNFSAGSQSTDSGDAISPGKKQQRSHQQQRQIASITNDAVTKSKLPRKLSLQKLLQKVDSEETSAGGEAAVSRQTSLQSQTPAQRHSCDDPDQREMGKRIKKCLALKETLKSVLCTVQGTQDTETCALRKMKKLRNELKVVCSAEMDPSVAREGGAAENAFCSLSRQKLLCENNSGNENSSGSNSVPNSSNNLHGLGYASDHGSDDSCCFGEERTRLGGGPDHGQLVNSHPPRATPPVSVHIPSANIPIIPPAHHITPSQLAAVAVSGVAAFSFMTSATTGSDEGEEGDAMHEERLSIGSNSSFGEDLDFQEAALECVDGLKSLIQQEADAKVKLAKLASLINAASTINQQLQLNVASVSSSGK